MKRIALGFVLGLACSSGLVLAQGAGPRISITPGNNSFVGVDWGTSYTVMCSLAGVALPSQASTLTVSPLHVVAQADGQTFMGATLRCGR